MSDLGEMKYHDHECLKGLRPQHQKFVIAYVHTKSATQAYFAAGYKTSTRNAESSGHKLLKNKKVRTAIDILMNLDLKEFNSRYVVTRDRIVDELASIAFTNLEDIAEWSVEGGKVKFTPKEMDQLDPRARAAIDSMEVSESYGEKGESYSFRLKRNSKLKALEILAKLYGGDDNDPGRNASAIRQRISNLINRST